MMVRELIDQLNLLPDDLEVVISDPVNGEYYGGIDSTGVEIVGLNQMSDEDLLAEYVESTGGEET